MHWEEESRAKIAQGESHRVASVRSSATTLKRYVEAEDGGLANGLDGNTFSFLVAVFIFLQQNKASLQQGQLALINNLGMEIKVYLN